MIYLLDTNTVSELRKPKPDARCVAWVNRRKLECGLSVVTLAELGYGVERLPEGKRKEQHRRDLAYLVEDYRGRFFDFDGPAATEWARYAALLETEFGADWWKTFDFRDTQIAATAREYGLIVATRNAKHFPFCDVENPFA
ncbi:MAG: PIN domain-containing protein [Limisphaerales bacterium]